MMDDGVQIDVRYDEANPGDEVHGQEAAAGEALAVSEPGVLDRAMGAVATLQSTHVLTLSAGRRAVPNVMGKAVMVCVGGGVVYFQPDKETLYEVVEVAWDGPCYQQRMVTDTTSSSKTKGGRRGRVAGALIGSLLLPGVGTVVGAAIGTGSKAKTKGVSRSETYQEAVEVPAPCHILLEKLSTGEEIVITTDVMSDRAPRLLDLVEGYEVQAEDVAPEPTGLPVEAVPSPEQRSAPAISPYEELKQLKELLDLGILTQEEFDERKASLLG